MNGGIKQSLRHPRPATLRLADSSSIAPGSGLKSDLLFCTCQVIENILLSERKHINLMNMRRKATFDSSFWVHAVYLDLVDFLLEDYDLTCTPAVEDELGQGSPTSLRLKALLNGGRIKRAAPKQEKVKLYGKGERAAINLALEKKILLLIDDWKPYEAARQAAIETTNSLVYMVKLYDRELVSLNKILNALAKIARRGTLKEAWISSCLKMVAAIRGDRSKKGRESDEEKQERKDHHKHSAD